MKISEHKTSTCAHWVLEGELTIYHAASIKSLLVSHLNGVDVSEIEIDLSNISDCDTAGAQLLLLIKREGQRRNVSVKMIRHSPCVLDVFEVLNIGAFFGDPVLIPGSQKGTTTSRRASP